MLDSDGRVDARKSLGARDGDVDDESERENRPPGKRTTTMTTREGDDTRERTAREVNTAPKVMRASEEASDEEDGLAGERRGGTTSDGGEGETLRCHGVVASGGATSRRGVFDLDHTIIDVNSSWLWVKSEINSGRVGVSLIGRRCIGFEIALVGTGRRPPGKTPRRCIRVRVNSRFASASQTFSAWSWRTGFDPDLNECWTHKENGSVRHVPPAASRGGGRGNLRIRDR